MAKYESTLQRIEMIQQITKQHYEEGNQSRSYKAVWRNHIRPQFGICYRTYLNYVNAAHTQPTIAN